MQASVAARPPCVEPNVYPSDRIQEEERSELGLIGEANVAACCASKGGGVMLSKAMTIGHSAEGVRVNALCPGHVATALLEGVSQSADDPAAFLSGGTVQRLPSRWLTR